MVCRIATALFVLLYAAALFVFAAGTWGWFGSEPDPLAGVFLVPLGLPWNRLLDFTSDSMRPILGVLAPAINLAIIAVLCSFLRRKPANG
jgi:hypothetical protein